MSARIRCFIVENNYGTINLGDHTKYVSMEASKTLEGATGFTSLDIVNGKVTRRRGVRGGDGTETETETATDASLDATSATTESGVSF